jgi:signal transduction histidine kinase
MGIPHALRRALSRVPAISIPIAADVPAGPGREWIGPPRVSFDHPAARAMQFPLAQQGFELRLSIQEKMPEIEADADAIQQAILNLLTSAMQYSGDAREIDLRIGVTGGPCNGDAFIEVIDHGLGLTPDEQKQIFEKFYRVPSRESRLIAGTGLGLTLVAHIAKAHGGRVEVESAPGRAARSASFFPSRCTLTFLFGRGNDHGPRH